MITLRLLQFSKEALKKLPFYKHLFFLFYLREKAQMVAKWKGFAEYGEDVVIERLLGGVRFFVDIGAADGYHSSNTFYWALRGARGVCFEPVPEAFARLKSLYILNTRINCVNAAISDQDCQADMIVRDVLSYIPTTLDEAHLNLHREWRAGEARLQKIWMVPFAKAMESLRVPQTIDLISVDVEGHELNVLKSIPFDVYSFRAVIVETHLRDAHGSYLWKHRDLQDIEKLLGSHGYKPVWKSNANTVYAGPSIPEDQVRDTFRGRECQPRV